MTSHGLNLSWGWCPSKLEEHIYILSIAKRGTPARRADPPSRTDTPRQTPPPCPLHGGIHTPAPLYAGIHDLCPLHAGIHTPCKQNDRQTCVKTLPCPKLRLRAAINAKIISITTYPHQARHKLLHSRRMFYAQDLHMADMSFVRS